MSECVGARACVCVWVEFIKNAPTLMLVLMLELEVKSLLQPSGGTSSLGSPGRGSCNTVPPETTEFCVDLGILNPCLGWELWTFQKIKRAQIKDKTTAKLTQTRQRSNLHSTLPTSWRLERKFWPLVSKRRNSRWRAGKRHSPRSSEARRNR